MVELKNRYAAALFELSVESKMLKSHVEQAVSVRDVLQNHQCQNFLLHPHISNGAKQGLLRSLFADKISIDLMSFLYLAVEKNRESLIVPALSNFIDMGEKHCGKVVANVVSAVQLTERQISALQTMLSKKLDKKVEIQARVDPALIGGFYVEAEGRLIDGTVRTQLNNMKESLIREDTE